MKRALAAAAVALALAGCGTSSSTTTSTVGGGAETTTSTSGDQVVIQAQHGAFDPKAVYEKVSAGVVTILSTFGSSSGGGIFGGASAGQGSGFVVSTDGEIVTNAHVVTDAETAGQSGSLHEADQVFVEFEDRNRVQADVLGFDPFADVALLKVDTAGLDFHPLTLGDSDAAQVGDPVAAIGSPFGQEESLSVGVISATDRSVQSLTRFGIDNALQTDASINPGNSGGPLLNASGEVIGINQQINTTSGGGEGVGFAVPSNLVKRSLGGLREDGHPDYAYIGVTSQPLYPQLAKELGLSSDTGSLIARVVPDGPADDAGLQGGSDSIHFQGQRVITGGDVILSVDGTDVVADSDLPTLISSYKPGDTVTLSVLRGGQTHDVDVKLGRRPGS